VTEINHHPIINKHLIYAPVTHSLRTVLAGLFSRLFGCLLDRWRCSLAAGIGIAAFTLGVGASPSVVRAAIMGGLALFPHSAAVVDTLAYYVEESQKRLASLYDARRIGSYTGYLLRIRSRNPHPPFPTGHH
jgi:hypothetical protein